MDWSFGFLFVVCFLCTSAQAEDFYEMLGVAKNADQREIRKAFKKKALELHPDKNTDDPDAHDRFVRMNRAYEVLKDEDLRKKYDMYGEEGLEEGSHGHQYHSWNYYHDNFGIYDDDPEIITLNKADFEQSVTGSEDIWFINFYHPMCSHCHTLAPVWREVARELEGVVRIGAVNCDDDYHLCSMQGIRSYPSLISYPGSTHYRQEKSKEKLINYMLQKVQSPVVRLTTGNFKSVMSKEDFAKRPWLVVIYEDAGDAEDFWITQTKLGAIFDGLVNVGHVTCSQDKKMCSKLGVESGLKFFDNGDKMESGEGKEITSLDAQEIAREVLALLPEMELLEESTYKNLRQKLESREQSVPWLIQFSSSSDDDTLEIRKLPGLLPSLNLGRIDCTIMKRQCDELYIAKTPTFILFKPGGGYELHHGRLLAHDIAVFAREGASATRFQILTPQEFPKVLQDGSTWFVDFYAPWCPPCMKLLPEFRKASRLVQTPINFGSIDCTMHQDLCTKFNIRQYPTTILYNQSVPHEYTGHHSAFHLVEFVKDTLNPAVVILDPEKFSKYVAAKPQGEIWVVDYFAHWCGPCLSMAPEYRRFARMVSDMPEVHVASIDCAEFGEVCRKQGISSYPSVFLYSSDGYGTQNRVKFSGWSRDADTFRQWLYSSLPSTAVELDERSFETVLRSRVPWLIDFYTPWCGHCQVFAPTYEDIARAIKDEVKVGKLNCERYIHTCRGAYVRAYPTVRMYIGSHDGSRQNVHGIGIENLEKEDVIRKVKQLLPKRNSRHDEL